MARYGTVVKMNYIGIGMLMRSEKVRAHLTLRMERALAKAQETAPVESGDYRDSLRIEQVSHPTRAVVRITSNLAYARVVESRTGCLARALDAAKGAL